MNAVIGIDKPEGITSFDVVAKLRKATRIRKIGHAGTLDPLATGVLVICFGAATRIVSRLIGGRKTYEAGIFLGRSTDTADSAGITLLEDRGFKICYDRFLSALQDFKGDILQVPPMYSALKVEGKKLCNVARSGGYVERAARKVTVFRLESHQVEPSELSYGTIVRLSIECSQGTYIRTLCEDIGKSMGIPCHMSSLRRTRSSGFGIGECIGLVNAIKLAEEGKLAESARLIPEALPDMPKLVLTIEEKAKVSCGNNLVLDYCGEDEAMLLSAGGHPVAIAKAFKENAPEGKAIYRPEIVFNIAEVRQSDGKQD